MRPISDHTSRLSMIDPYRARRGYQGWVGWNRICPACWHGQQPCWGGGCVVQAPTHHTPGPWYRTSSSPDGTVYSADHTLIVPLQPIGYTSKDQWANARLIAAAPELLAALRDVVAQIAAYDHLHGKNSCMIDDGPALSAIATATGEPIKSEEA